jgi:hypothetical protein
LDDAALAALEDKKEGFVFQPRAAVSDLALGYLMSRRWRFSNVQMLI